MRKLINKLFKPVTLLVAGYFYRFMDAIKPIDLNAKQFIVCVPYHNPEGYVFKSERMTYADAIAFARTHFGADDDGCIFIVRADQSELASVSQSDNNNLKKKRHG